MNWRELIHADPAILGGKPVVKGTRISVELILQYLAEGGTADDVYRAYPHLPTDAVRAAIAFAHDMIEDEATLAAKRAA